MFEGVLSGSLKAVTFDVGGTLIEPWPSVGHVYADIAARHGHGALVPEQLQTRFAEAWNAETGFDHSRAGWRAIVTRTFEGLVPTSALDGLFTELYARFSDPDVWHVFDDVLPTLESLRSAGIQLGVISNWDERLRPLLERLDLARWFNVMTISCEIGATKPAAAIYEAAASQLRLRPQQILHVGDRREEDLVGAQAAGFQALLIDRKAGNSWALGTLHLLPAALAGLHLGQGAD